MNTKESLVKLIYKAAVTQNTGEPWDNVPLQLETSTPTFGLALPTLNPWNLAVRQQARSSLLSTPPFSTPPPPAGPPPPAPLARRSLAKPAMAVASTSGSSKGNVNATYPVSIPKIDPKAHLSARVTNASEYTLLSGEASIYVDGSSISRSCVPPVSPQESFDCPLGLDPSVRITYHPVLKDRTESGFCNKTATHTFSQRITIHNTKTVPLSRLKDIDQIPTSQDSQIEVKLLSPALIRRSQHQHQYWTIETPAAGPRERDCCTMGWRR
ncbi:hypothetical protein C8F01DRAFT_1362382 [Mycena amicta]|nr:hypothetical protein C8F01DRAFT_1235567 [Mycena amicta]KAJ7070477.1 hypothetical protein C8F01DRAFT_1362382 [Mycena amicta]